MSAPSSSAGASRSSAAPGPKPSTTRPSFSSSPGALDQRRRRARLEIDDQRAEQDLPDDAAFASRWRFSFS